MTGPAHPDIVRILHFIDHSRVGGPGKTILNSAKFIDRGRFEIYAACFCNGNGSDLSRAVEERGIPHLALRDRNGVEWSHVSDMREYILANRIDVLHTHGYKTDFLGVIQKRLARELVLVTTHHGWIRNNLKQNMYAIAGMSLSRFFDGVMIVSRSMERFLPSSVKRRGAFTVIHNAIVMEDYECRGPGGLRREFGVSESEILIGVIGRLSPEKGCLEMLAAFHAFRKEHERVKLVFIGEGVLRTELEGIAKRLGLRDKVIFAGYREPVAPVYGELDVLVCPSRTEGLSNVILEAMACRTPVIATDVGGNAEIITSGHDGILIKRACIEELRGPLLELTGSRYARERIIRNARRTVQERFSFAARMRKEEEFYSELLKKAKNGK